MTWFNDGPHSVHIPKAERATAKRAAKGPTFEQRLAKAQERLRAGETILLTRSPRDRFQWERTGALCGKALFRALKGGGAHLGAQPRPLRGPAWPNLGVG